MRHVIIVVIVIFIIISQAAAAAASASPVQFSIIKPCLGESIEAAMPLDFPTTFFRAQVVGILSLASYG